MKKEIIKAIEEGTLYSYICSNYYLLSAEELKRLIMELDYIIYFIGNRYLSIKDRDDVKQALINNIKEYMD